MPVKIRGLCLVLIMVGTLAANAHPADLTAYVGGIKPGKLDLNGLKAPLDGSPIWGVRLNTNFIPMVGFEHTLGFSSDFLFPRSIASVTKARGFVYNSNLMINVPVGNMVPYITAGVGLLHQYGSPDVPVGTKFAFNYGGGLKFPRLIGPLGLRFDARGYTATGILSHSLNMFEASGGLLISLGR